MHDAPEPRIRHLRAYLERGIAPGAEVADVRRELGIAESAPDADVARSLVQIVSAVAVASLGPRRAPPTDDDEAGAPRSVRGAPRRADTTPPRADPSFLGRLSVSGAHEPAVGDLDDPGTLACVLRAGSLRQRRAAARRLAEVFEERKHLDGDLARRVAELRDPALDHELRPLRAALPDGAPDDEEELWDEGVKQALAAVDAFWDGERPGEPFAALPGELRALLLHRMRDLPEVLVRHVAAVLEGEDGASSLAARRHILTACRHAGDPRLVPTLVGLLTGPAELRTDAAHALASIDDPRVKPALAAAFDRSVEALERAELAGALGAAGDRRGAPYARALLEREDREARVAALRALEHVGGVEDVPSVLPLLAAADPDVLRQAVRTLARLGDRRALAPLGRAYTEARIPGLRAEIEEAEAAIRARMEVLGEDLGERVALAVRPEERAAAGEDAPVHHRLRGLWDYVVGQLLLAIGAMERGIARLERAATRRPRWSLPWVSIALAFARRGEHAAALGAFRHALSADRVRLERNPIVVRALARAFLRRAEEVERDGRLDIARGLLGEALAFDLRRAPSTLRFELERQHDLLRRRPR
jgi:HEAT repeat protein